MKRVTVCLPLSNSYYITNFVLCHSFFAYLNKTLNIYPLSYSFEYYIIDSEVIPMTIDSQNLLESILESLDRIDYIHPEDVPGIDLYMDQVTTFMDSQLKSSKRY